MAPKGKPKGGGPWFGENRGRLKRPLSSSPLFTRKCRLTACGGAPGPRQGRRGSAKADRMITTAFCRGTSTGWALWGLCVTKNSGGGNLTLQAGRHNATASWLGAGSNAANADEAAQAYGLGECHLGSRGRHPGNNVTPMNPATRLPGYPPVPPSPRNWMGKAEANGILHVARGNRQTFLLTTFYMKLSCARSGAWGRA